MKKKNNVRSLLSLSIALLMGLNPALSTAWVLTNQGQLEVKVIGMPAAPIVAESEQSKSKAELLKEVTGFLTFLKDGLKSVWFNHIVPTDYEKELAKGSGKDKLMALQLAMFRGIHLAMPTLMGIFILKGAKIGMNLAKRELLAPSPTILNKKQNPFHGRMARIHRWWFGYSEQKMIFGDQIADRLAEIEKKTVLLSSLIKAGKKRHYANLLLYGEPGTGKTIFARHLACATNMDFLPVTAASLLQKGVKGIKYFDELIAIANRSPYGAIIFIDEADGLFADRELLDPGSEHYKVLEHILSIIDGRSNKFMVIAATNRAQILDAAMSRRFQDHIMMPLPDKSTREKLLVLYAEQILFNEKETSKQFATATKALFNPELISLIADKTDGLSHAEIADMIEAMRTKAELNNQVLAMENIESAVAQAMAKNKKGNSVHKLA